VQLFRLVQLAQLYGQLMHVFIDSSKNVDLAQRRQVVAVQESQPGIHFLQSVPS
jgi:hypothetical protein